MMGLPKDLNMDKVKVMVHPIIIMEHQKVMVVPKQMVKVKDNHQSKINKVMEVQEQIGVVVTRIIKDILITRILLELLMV